MRLLCIFIFLGISRFSFSSEEFASLETDRDFIIDGKVNAISGSFIEFETDIEIPSIFPLRINRSSISQEFSRGNKWVGWHLDLFGECVHEPDKKSRTKIRDENGTALVFVTKDNQFGTFVPIMKDFAKGETNLGRHLIGGKTSLKNCKVQVEKSRNKIVLQSGGGIKTTYLKGKIEGEGDRQYKFDRVDTPDGFAITYGQSKPWQWIKRSFSATGHCLGEFVFDDVEAIHVTPRVCLYTSDNRRVIYNFKVHQNTLFDNPKMVYGLLSSVDSSSKPLVQYCYDDHTSRHRERLTLKMLPDNRYVEIGYYTPGVDKGVDSSTFDCNRVKTLTEPAFNNQKVVTKQFEYHQLFDKKQKFIGGSTDVLDFDRNKSTYSYNKEYRPTEIVHFIGKKPHIKHQLFWGDPAKEKEGYLAAKIVRDQTGYDYKAKALEYDDQGNIVQEVFYGNLTGTSFHHPNFSPLGEVTNPNAEGFVKNYKYEDSEFNNLTEEIHENGLRILYAYEPRTTRLKTKIIRSETFDHTFEYSYHPCGALVQIIESDGNFEKVTKHTPRLNTPCFGFPEVTEEFYQDQGELVLLKRTEIEYDPCLAKPTKITVYDANNQFAYSESYEYKRLGCCSKEVKRTGEIITRDEDSNGNILFEKGPKDLYIKRFFYDMMNRLTHEEVELKDGTVYQTYNQYHGNGALISTTDPYGNRTTFENDRYCRPIKMTNPLGEAEHRKYDIFGNQTFSQDPKGFITKTTFNAYDKPLSIRYPDGSSETFVYNKDGTLKESISKSGLKTSFDVDCLGRVVKKWVGDDQEIYCYKGTLLTRFTNLKGVETVFEYDGAGRKVLENRAGAVTTFAYDPLGRLYRTSRYHGGELISSKVEKFDAADRVVEKWVEDPQGNIFLYEKYGYDPLGNRNLEIRGDAITTFEYDGLNRLIKKRDAKGYESRWIYLKDPHQEIEIQPNGVRIVKSFDLLNRPHLEERFDGETLLSSIRFHYDGNGNVEEEVHQMIGGEGELKIVRSYDGLNRLKTLLEAQGKFTEYDYTPNGELKWVKKPDGKELHYEYDRYGYLKSLTSKGSIDYLFNYDPLGQLLSVSDKETHVERTYTKRGQLETETYLNNLFTYEYDDLDRLTKVTFPDQSIIEYEHSVLGIKSLKRNGLTHTNLEYDFFGNAVKEELMDGSIRLKSYNVLNRLDKVSHHDYSIDLLQYDCMGNLIQKDDNVYTYDALNQLRSESGDFCHHFAFDSVYNMQEKDCVPLEVNDLNQILSDKETHYTYDLNGNLIKKLGPKGGWIFRYDDLDRMISSERDGEVIEYVYDGLHRRLLKRAPGRAELYWYILEDEVAAQVDGKLTSFRALAPQGEAVFIEVEGFTLVPHYDQGGNLVKLGEESCLYSSFGEQSNPHFISPWRFSSKRYDPETEFTYFGRRYYSIELARWTSCDPLSFSAGINLYAYVNNNPWRYFDRRGLWTEPRLGTLFFDSFEKFAHPQNYSFSFDLGIPDQEDIGIGFINGIKTNSEECRGHTEYISDLSGKYNVHGVYNATHGPYDILECILGWCGIATDPVRELHQTWNHFFANNSPGAYFLMIGHSQGCIHIKNALDSYPEELRKRIFVVAIAPGTYIDRNECGGVKHYRASPERDFIPMLNIFGGMKSLGTIAQLDSHPDANIHDHNFQSPTYRPDLTNHLNKYTTSRGRKY